MRRELSEKLERLAKLRVYAAARTLGRFGKRVVEQRVAFFIVAWVRFRLIMREKYKRARASTKIQSVLRTFKQRQRYREILKCITKVQSVLRQYIAARKVRKLRDPYCDMSYKDLKRLLRDEISRMQEAAEAKNFQAAAEIETKM